MTTPAQGNFPESSAKLEGGFEASGLSIEEADRLAASFKPSWEFDEAPFAEGGALRNGDLEALEAGGAREVYKHPDSGRSHTVPAHAPPARVETHEPEVSVIIDRSITAPPAEVRAAPPAPVPAPFAMPPVSANRIVAPVARSRFNADESLELPTALKKSNKGLFIGLGAAVAAAVLVFAVRAAMSSPEDAQPSSGTTNTASTTGTPTAAPPPPVRTAAVIPPPPPVAAPPPPVQTTSVSALPQASHAAPAPRPATHASPSPHHAAPAPRNPPKPPSGGIVRDVPF